MEIAETKLARFINVLYESGKFLREQGHPEQALACFLALSEGDETYENGEYAYQVGLCYRQLNDGAKAASYFAIAVANNPTIPRYRKASEETNAR